MPKEAAFMRHFNVTGLCTPDKDYMVDISDKIQKIRGMVDMEEYFTINRARQYGKTKDFVSHQHLRKI